MGKLAVTEFVSVDGVFEDPGGAENYEHGGWTFEYDRGEDGNQFKLDELTEAKVHLLGRVTYPEWQNTTVLAGDVVGEVSKLKEKTDGVVLVAGSGTLVGTLLAAGLVDEL